MKRSRLLALKNGFAKKTQVDINKINCNTYPEMRILRWDQSMLSYPNYKPNLLENWLNTNKKTLISMVNLFYNKFYLVFTKSGYEIADLQNIALWHAFIYLQTPHLKNKTGNDRIWAHIRQRLLETVLILQNKNQKNAVEYVESLDKFDFFEKEDNMHLEKSKALLCHFLNNYKDLVSQQYLNSVIYKLSKIEDPKDQKKWLTEKMEGSKKKINKEFLGLLLEIYKYV